MRRRAPRPLLRRERLRRLQQHLVHFERWRRDQHDATITAPALHLARPRDFFYCLKAALDVLTLMPAPLGLVTVVVLVVKLPPTLVRLMPVALLLTDSMLAKLAGSS